MNNNYTPNYMLTYQFPIHKYLTVYKLKLQLTNNTQITHLEIYRNINNKVRSPRKSYSVVISS